MSEPNQPLPGFGVVDACPPAVATQQRRSVVSAVPQLREPQITGGKLGPWPDSVALQPTPARRDLTVDDLMQIAVDAKGLQQKAKNLEAHVNDLVAFLFLAAAQLGGSIPWPGPVDVRELQRIMAERKLKLAYGGQGIQFRGPIGGGMHVKIELPEFQEILAMVSATEAKDVP